MSSLPSRKRKRGLRTKPDTTAIPTAPTAPNTPDTADAPDAPVNRPNKRATQPSTIVVSRPRDEPIIVVDDDSTPDSKGGEPSAQLKLDQKLGHTTVEPLLRMLCYPGSRCKLWSTSSIPSNINEWKPMLPSDEKLEGIITLLIPIVIPASQEGKLGHWVLYAFNPQMNALLIHDSETTYRPTEVQTVGEILIQAIKRDVQLMHATNCPQQQNSTDGDIFVLINALCIVTGQDLTPNPKWAREIFSRFLDEKYAPASVLDEAEQLFKSSIQPLQNSDMTDEDIEMIKKFILGLQDDIDWLNKFKDLIERLENDATDSAERRTTVAHQINEVSKHLGALCNASHTKAITSAQGYLISAREEEEKACQGATEVANKCKRLQSEIAGVLQRLTTLKSDVEGIVQTFSNRVDQLWAQVEKLRAINTAPRTAQHGAKTA